MHNLAIVLLIAMLRTRFRTEKTLSQLVECLTILVCKELKQNVKKCESKTRNKNLLRNFQEVKRDSCKREHQTKNEEPPAFN